MEMGEGDPLDAVSVVSDWSMADDVRNILYDEEDSIVSLNTANHRKPGLANIWSCSYI